MADRLIANSIMSEELFFNDTPCWIWIGACCSGGYPKMALRWKSGPRKGKLRTIGAHRMSLMTFKGRRLTAKSRALHLCNVKRCINPEHLIGGSQLKNIRQCVDQGRHGNMYRAPVREQEQEKEYGKQKIIESLIAAAREHADIEEQSEALYG